jgi:hypothetical protein
LFYRNCFIEIPLNVQRCCTRCYEKLIIQIRQRQTTTQSIEEEEEEEEDEIQSNIADEPSSKHNDGKKLDMNFKFYYLFQLKIEWTENEIDAFTEALHKFKNDWRKIAEYVHRSEQSCRAFYQNHRKKNNLIDDIDEDNASRSGSEDTSHRLIKPRENQQIDEGKKRKQLFIFFNF